MCLARKIPVRTVVWVANRDSPLTERSGVLKVVDPGIPALLNATGTGNTIRSTNASTTVQTPVAQLLDSGDLVVKDANDDNPENFLWQSFNHPADTTLPGMKLGVNFQTGAEVYITSPKNSGDPASGDFTYHYDPTGYPQNVIKGGGVLHNSSGPWNGVSFGGSPNLRKNPIYKFGVVINEKEAYYHTEFLNDSVYSRFTISDTGVGQRWIWEYPKQSWIIYLTIPSDNCDIYNVCGPHSNCNIENTPPCGCLDKFKPKGHEGWDSGARSGGCIRSTPLNCENGDAFLKYFEMKLPNTEHSWYNTTMNLEECKVVCLKNCSCMAYTSLDISRGGNGCLLWFDELVDIKKVSPGQDIYIRIASSELGRMRVNNVDNHPGVSHNEELDLPLFDLSTICKATGNFSINNELGHEGGFGPVYKGVLEDGQEISVKHLSKTSRQGVDEFNNEVICIAKLQHRNLVKLLGWCSQGDEMMLVYEYMTNKSLNKILFDPTQNTLLDWPRRLNIINGIARDFGLARTFGGSEIGANTSRVVGTLIYTVDGVFSVKSDVYSFGVLVLEIVSGKRNRGFVNKDHRLNLLGHKYNDQSTLVFYVFKNILKIGQAWLQCLDKSQNRYVGIWYNKIPVRTVVWVANRDNPLTERSGVLKVVDPGILALLNATGSTIWTTNTSRIVQTPVAQLLDSGNLVVKDANDDIQENFVWQSFNHPTDTSLPGMKLGVNFQTGAEVYITSPKNRGDPASGDFTFHCDPTGYSQNVIKGGGVLQFSTGPWNGVSFSGSLNLRKNTIFTFGVVINEKEAYFHTELLNQSVYSRFTLSDSGVGQRWIWENQKQSWSLYLTFPSDTCDIYNVCGPHGICDIEKTTNCRCLNKFEPKDPDSWGSGDWSEGCIRSTPLNCENGDLFLKYTGVKLPNSRHTWYNTTMTLEECKVVCLKNCSCMAYTSLDISRGGNGCLLWFGELVDIREMTPGQYIYVRLASSELDSGGRKRKILIVVIPLITGILLLSLSLMLYFQKRNKLNDQLLETGRMRLNNEDNHPGVNHNEDLELPLFDLTTISKATENFSINNKLGEGGFGPVYKGVLEDGNEIAVKRLSRTSHQGIYEFKNEIVCIAKLQHRNLVKLLGWCFEGDEMMLVYEYMTNKSLDVILFDPTKNMLLDWPKRLNIINGIARALMYLHQDSRLRVIHRDLKASNILLDLDMNPKISDFGLAKTFGGNETGANTSRVVGTFGYMSPEYAIDGIFSVKSDVFSFGVLVLEIVSGKRNRGFMNKDHDLNLLGHAWILYKDKRSEEAVDSCLRHSSYLPEIQRSIHIALLCVQEHVEDRPGMASVVHMMSNDGSLPEAKRPGFFTARDVLTCETSVGPRTTSSKNSMSITLMEAR
ncbi:hypothetical protein ACS0TY_017086 [Phlomoides rotata]